MPTRRRKGSPGRDRSRKRLTQAEIARTTSTLTGRAATLGRSYLPTRKTTTP